MAEVDDCKIAEGGSGGGAATTVLRRDDGDQGSRNRVTMVAEDERCRTCGRPCRDRGKQCSRGAHDKVTAVGRCRDGWSRSSVSHHGPMAAAGVICVERVLRRHNTVQPQVIDGVVRRRVDCGGSGPTTGMGGSDIFRQFSFQKAG
ncbi:uncharacterized protein LOC127128995 [Lathyrus oleraceus]|uniref:uncharacterized protein LOC127128995 n=1 Tax=Pisum sativum TaxID=3888 RepID=UPI001FC541D2|nr:uncharacterized protein LOC127128995 [Pisum sativum]